MKKTLVVMAAGMGSRFGGLKQIEPVGPSGEFIIDYSIYDAIRCGFDKVVFIIREENYEVFKETIGKRIEPFIEVCYAFQKIDDLPVKVDLKEREKPLGTGHAIYAAREYVDGNFAVINADDFYGYGAIKIVSEFLDNDLVTDKENYALIGYKLGNTVTENGSVKRGICLMDDNKLTGLLECSCFWKDNKLYKVPLGSSLEEETNYDSLVSMNLFGFPKEFMNHITDDLKLFIEENKNDMSSAEFFMPRVVTKQIRNGNAVVTVIPTSERWYGMTYKEDKDEVVNAIKDMIEKGIYKNNLWEE